MRSGFVALTLLALFVPSMGCGSNGDGTGAGNGGAGGAEDGGGAGGAGGGGGTEDRDGEIPDDRDGGGIPVGDASLGDGGDAGSLSSCDCGPNGTCAPGDPNDCLCDSGWTGAHCEIDMDDCVAHGCQNGAGCLDRVGGLECDCWPGYSGTHCELPIVAEPGLITCPASGRPDDGWPLVFTFNGNCFKAVDDGGLAAEAAAALVSAGIACAVAVEHGDLETVSDIDAFFRGQIVPRIQINRGLVNTQKIGAIGFSAGGTVAAHLGSRWAQGIDPEDGTDHEFRVGAVIDFYGPLRMDRTHATNAQDALTGGGGLLYLHETRAAGLQVDIPGVRQWSSSDCFCAARGTDPCNCQDASEAYLAAYQPASGICAFDLDSGNLSDMSVTAYVAEREPVHVAALYLCSGWKDSNVDHDMNMHQATSFWRTEHLVTVTAEDGHGFPLSVCESSATAASSPQPLEWLVEKASTYGSFQPLLP